MELSKTYSPSEVEDKWYSYWLKNGFFESKPDQRTPYTIVIPPPNVTGVLHMGHMLNNTVQDVIIRRARMRGFNACWVPGTDHASIATETKVLELLKEKGIDKSQLTREDFLKHAWEWKEKYGGIILQQLKKLGASCDWSRTKFTMDDDLSESVLKIFVDLYKKDKIYRGVRMINWDPKAKTALSDEEVIYKEVQSKLYQIKYKIEGTSEFITIATTRPETILGDTAIAVHPEDERYTHLKGKRALVPLINRSIPIIFDEYVDREFGTGALKVTPAHDINDYNLGIKHNLESIDILNDDGTLNASAQLYVGLDRFAVRKKIVAELEEKNHLGEIKDIKNNVGYSERTDVVIEPKLSMQWFCKMQDMAKPALANVLNDEIKLYPAKFKNTYQHWMENIKDWCISRQLWWGQRIPAWYYGAGANDYVVALTEEEALEEVAKKTGKTLSAADLRQDEDVLDTWFSSWLWPLSVFDGIRNPNNPDAKYYYPTNDLVTGSDIIFFWVARMIMAGYEFADQKPFKNVYFTGIIRDKLRRKMSKSLGNSPDALELIQKYGADGVRVGMLLSSPAGNDLLFDEQYCEQGRNFSNKLWNSYRLVQQWVVIGKETPAANKIAIEWMQSKLAQTLVEINDHYDKFRMSDALMATYKLIWDDYCAWYLEMIKPAYGEPIDNFTYEATVAIFEKLLIIVHPFMPFITEELWQGIQERKANESICITPWPSDEKANANLITNMDVAQKIITEIRNFRKQNNLSIKESLPLQAIESTPLPADIKEIVMKLGLLHGYENIESVPAHLSPILIGTNQYFLEAPEGSIDPEEEKDKLQAELEYNRGFLNSVMKKLSNEKFMQGAPQQVVDIELKKKADAEEKIKILEKKLGTLV